MSADLLRRAAAKIRSTATLADRELDGDAWDTTDPGYASDLENHIALWSPGVALLVADYLDSFNEDLADEVAVNEGDCDCSNCVFAWKLARSILGDDS